MKPLVRIDQLLVERGLAASRHKAQAMVLAAEVLVDEQKIDKPGRRVSPDAAVRLLGRKLPYVGRGGLKLAAALDRFHIDPAGRVCLDVGASTGGFTDCLLQRGAAKVYAVDVGQNQLDWKLRNDPRVVSLEKVNARRLSAEEIPEPCGFFCCDVSFISVTLILPVIGALLTPEAEAVVLCKPQFEVGKGEVGKGGVVRDPILHQAAADKVSDAVQAMGFQKVERMESPILGAEGNLEFLIHGSELSRST